MHRRSLYFDRLTIYLLDEVARVRQIPSAALIRMIFDHYLQAQPSYTEMLPPMYFCDAQQRTYRLSRRGPCTKYPYKRHGYFDDEELRQLTSAAGKLKVPLFMRQVVAWWLNLPQNKELVDQLLKRFEAQQQHTSSLRE